MPQSRGISISRKILESSERGRLKSLVSLNKPPGVGVIIRTEAEHQKESDLKEDLETLMERWQNIVSMSESSKAPSLLYRDQDLLHKVIREGVSEDVSEIVVDTPFGHQRAQQLLQTWNLDKNIKATQHTGSQSIMLALGVDREIKQAVQSRVPLPSGGYLFIQPTEALCVIDVNSGKFTSMASQAQTIKHTNLESCKEIARQMRLRNIGGMIIVDFIDMESRADQLEVLEAFEKALLPDKAKPQVGQITDLGLVEMTRHRQGQALSEIFTRKCTSCHGSGHALEDTHWAPPGVDTPFRPGQRGAHGRNNRLPIRQTNQQGNRPPAGNPNRQGAVQGRGGNRRPGQPGGPQQNQQGPANRMPGGQPASPAVTALQIKEKADTWRRFETLMHQSKLQAKYKQILEASESLFATQQKQPVPTTIKSILFRESLTLEDSLKEALNLVLGGTSLATMVKFSYAPPLANNTLARINPRSNNVLTLVDGLESSVELPSNDDSDDDDGDDDDTQGDDGDNRQPANGMRQPAGAEMATGAGNGERHSGVKLPQRPMPSGSSGRPMPSLGQPIGVGSYRPGQRPMVPHARPVLPVGPSRPIGVSGGMPGQPPPNVPNQPLISVVAPPAGAPTKSPPPSLTGVMPAASSIPVASLFGNPTLPPAGSAPMTENNEASRMAEVPSDVQNVDVGAVPATEATAEPDVAAMTEPVSGETPVVTEENVATTEEATKAKPRAGRRPARGSSKTTTPRTRKTTTTRATSKKKPTETDPAE